MALKLFMSCCDWTLLFSIFDSAGIERYETCSLFKSAMSLRMSWRKVGLLGGADMGNCETIVEFCWNGIGTPSTDFISNGGFYL